MQSFCVSFRRHLGDAGNQTRLIVDDYVEIFKYVLILLYFVLSEDTNVKGKIFDENNVSCSQNFYEKHNGKSL